MLWDLIRDFFVQHVFGGVDSTETYFNGYIGYIMNGSDNSTYGTLTDLCFPIGNVFTDGIGENFATGYISMGDWLSTTATAISITIIVVLCCMFIYKIIKLIGGLIR